MNHHGANSIATLLTAGPLPACWAACVMCSRQATLQRMRSHKAHAVAAFT